MSTTLQRPVYASRHALKFFKQDGWGKTLLDDCCRSGEVICYNADDIEAYYILAPGSSFNSQKLLEHVSIINRSPYYECPHLDDVAYVKSLNY